MIYNLYVKPTITITVLLVIILEMSKVFYDKPIIDQIFEEFENKGYEPDQDKLIKLISILPPEDINRQKNRDTALILASYFGITEIVKLLLEHKDIDVDIQDSHGWTALICATNERNTEIVKLLLEHKDIDINIQNYNGKTALMIAFRKGHTEIVKLLENHNST